MADLVEPTPDEVERVFTDLLSGRTTRQDAAEWATQWVAASEPSVGTARTWKALTELAMADSPTTDRPYLYSEEDFHAWLEEFRNGAPADTLKARTWSHLAFLFDIDDGSLPEIWVLNLSPAQIEAVINLLESLGNQVGGSPPEHIVVRGIRIAGVTIPDLGVSRGHAEVILDYRMGEGWNADSFGALMELLRRIRTVAPDSKFDLEPHALINVRRLFVNNVERYLASLTG